MIYATSIKVATIACNTGLVFCYIPHNHRKAAVDTKQSITVSPVKEIFELDSGEETSRKISVTNNGDTDMDFKLYAEPFSVFGEEYKQAFAEAPNAPSAAKWISFPAETLHIKAGEKVEADYNVKVTADASAGGHYATIFTETIPPLNSGGGITTIKRIGTILYFEIKGDITRSGGLSSFSSSFVQSAKPITASLRLNNDGNVHYPANGTLSLKNVLTRKTYQESFSGMILPSTTRKFERSWQNARFLGLYKITGDVNLLGQKTELQGKWVIYLPLGQLLIALALFALIIVLLIFFKKRNKKHNKKLTE